MGAMNSTHPSNVNIHKAIANNNKMPASTLSPQKAVTLNSGAAIIAGSHASPIGIIRKDAPCSRGRMSIIAITADTPANHKQLFETVIHVHRELASSGLEASRSKLTFNSLLIHLHKLARGGFGIVCKINTANHANHVDATLHQRHRIFMVDAANRATWQLRHFLFHLLDDV